MPERVDGKVGLIAEAGQPVVREAARPEQFAHRLVVGGVAHRAGGEFDHVPQQRLGEFVGQVGALLGDEVAVEGVHHDIGHAAGESVRRQGGAERRIHRREERAVEGGGVAALLAAVFVCDDARLGGLAPGGGDGEHHAERGAAPGGCAPLVELPDVGLRVEEAEADGLCRVEHAAAADREQEVDPFAPAELDALPHEREPRIRPHPAELHKGEPRRPKRLAHPGEQAASLRAAAAEVEQHAGAAERFDLLADFALGISAEEHLGADLIAEILHGKTPFAGGWWKGGLRRADARRGRGAIVVWVSAGEVLRRVLRRRRRGGRPGPRRGYSVAAGSLRWLRAAGGSKTRSAQRRASPPPWEEGAIAQLLRRREQRLSAARTQRVAATASARAPLSRRAGRRRSPDGQGPPRCSPGARRACCPCRTACR